MEIELDLQKRVEAYLRSVVVALQQESLGAKEVDRASEMLRQQIYETIEERSAGGPTDAPLVHGVLAEMPAPGDFALEAQLAAGNSHRRRGSRRFEWYARLTALILTLAVLWLCMEATILGAKSSLRALFNSPRSAESASVQPPAETQPAEFHEDDDDGLFLLFFWLILGLLLLVLAVIAVVTVVVFGAGAVLLGVSLTALNAAVARRGRSWMTFLRLCLWELVLAGGSLAGILGGALVWVVRPATSWRLCSYVGLGTGAVAGLLGAWLAVALLDWVSRWVIRHKQRHLPMLKLATLGKLRGIMSNSRRA